MAVRTYVLPVLTALLAALGAKHSQAQWSFHGLGTLGGDSSSALGVSADGSIVVGWSPKPDGNGRAFRWEGGSILAIADLPDSYASAVSADGSVVIMGNGSRPFRWENGSLLPLPVGTYVSFAGASDVSADGSVIVGQITWSSSPPPIESYTSAVAWGPRDDQGQYPLRTLRGLTSYPDHDYAVAVSWDGSVIVGESRNALGNPEAARWQGSRVLGLGTLGGASSAAADVSADGSVIVGSANRPDGLVEAFRWENHTMVGLGTLGGDWLQSFANAVSADGSVVVGYARQQEWSATSGLEAFIWDQPHGVRSLRGLLTQNGVDLSDWAALRAVGLSADGRLIVGNGYRISLGRDEAWIATVPEPSTLAGLATLAAALLLAHLCRRGCSPRGECI